MARRKRVREEAERVLGMLDIVVGWGGAIHAASGRGDWGLEDEKDLSGIIIYCVGRGNEKRLEKKGVETVCSRGIYFCKQVGLGLLLIRGLGWGNMA